MSESQSTGYGESPDTADSNENLIDGRTGDNASDRGEQDTATLTTDDEAQRDTSVVRGGNDAS
ncbi:hypothetical protein [Blastococcus sp. TF02A-26]|uniref:hypothetical protein n=1 Tax=Blastococcus sp. TF02A-26 TaxID=2250577 RepID=UPI000DE8CB06|nr:hypothetical protein [Blastococcus sp. TF02A-26]RBY82777.1 hypothetical protein DQ240_17835 [Blastococcus sp. TF02A-26]